MATRRDGRLDAGRLGCCFFFIARQSRVHGSAARRATVEVNSTAALAPETTISRAYRRRWHPLPRTRSVRLRTTDERHTAISSTDDDDDKPLILRAGFPSDPSGDHAVGAGDSPRPTFPGQLRPTESIIYCWLSSSSPTGRHTYGPPALGGRRGETPDDGSFNVRTVRTLPCLRPGHCGYNLLLLLLHISPPPLKRTDRNGYRRRRSVDRFVPCRVSPSYDRKVNK